MVAINIILFEHWFLHLPSGDNLNFSLSDLPWGITGIIMQNDCFSAGSFSVLSFLPSSTPRKQVILVMHFCLRA